LTTNEKSTAKDFIRTAVQEDNASGRFGGRVITRFPPEPNGYMHIGHAKSAHLNFSIANENGGHCNLRFDDTNPTKEEIEYIRSFQEDLRWLGFDWGSRTLYSSDYFDTLSDYAIRLIEKSKAYVCDLTQEEIKEYRGTLKLPGKESPYRNRSVEENIRLFQEMRQGKFEEGSRVLRAKIDMASGNLNMRDPVIYRILKSDHHRTGSKWCIYPTYDFAHGQSDSIEGVTHSICTIEFEDHRPLYDWLLNELEIYHPRQIEFARLDLENTVMSKRKLLQLVTDGHVDGWDDPRMPTISGMRRRGYTPESIRVFCDRIGIAKRNNTIEMALLEHCLREDLNKTSDRVLAVLDPLKIIIENYPEGKVEELEAINNPEDTSSGIRMLPFSREIYVERDDFSENPPKKFFRLAIGREVRLRYGYFITCTEVIKDDITGEIIELRCTYDPETRGGQAPDGRRVKGTIHWVSAAQSLPAQIRIYNHLFIENDICSSEDFMLNPNSIKTLTNSRVEPSMSDASPGDRFQFERRGYFCVDSKESVPEALVFNHTVSLRDTWSKIDKARRNNPA
jgi:glutaminyl-tRNA synthetase